MDVKTININEYSGKRKSQLFHNKLWMFHYHTFQLLLKS